MFHSLVAAVLVLLLVIFLIYRRSSQLLPPSPPSLPILGHLHLIGKAPHQSMLQLSRKYGGLMFLKLGTVRSIVVSSPEAAKLVLKAQDHIFSSRSYTLESEYIGYGGSGLVFAPYGDHWRLARKLCTLSLLTAKRVEMARPFREAEMKALLRYLCTERGTVCNLTTKLSDFTFNTMLKMVICKSNWDEAQAFKDGIMEMFRVSNGIHIANFFPCLKWMDRQVYRIKAVHESLSAILQREIEERRISGNYKDGKDFIDVMLADGLLTDTAIKALSQDMVGGGTDTAASTVEWAISELIKNPDALKNAQEEMDNVIGRKRALEEADIPQLKYLRAVVTETLRLHPAISLIPRENSTQECQLGEYVIPAKTRVYVSAYAIGRNAAVWNEPLKFQPSRFLEHETDVRGQCFELIPFGSGRRMCPGMQLGITTVSFLLGSLIHAFDWQVPNGSDAQHLDMSEHFGLSVARASPLLLVPVPRLENEAYENDS